MDFPETGGNHQHSKNWSSDKVRFGKEPRLIKSETIQDFKENFLSFSFLLPTKNKTSKNTINIYYHDYLNCGYTNIDCEGAKGIQHKWIRWV